MINEKCIQPSFLMCKLPGRISSVFYRRSLLGTVDGIYARNFRSKCPTFCSQNSAGRYYRIVRFERRILVFQEENTCLSFSALLLISIKECHLCYVWHTHRHSYYYSEFSVVLYSVIYLELELVYIKFVSFMRTDHESCFYNHAMFVIYDRY